MYCTIKASSHDFSGTGSAAFSASSASSSSRFSVWSSSLSWFNQGFRESVAATPTTSSGREKDIEIGAC